MRNSLESTIYKWCLKDNVQIYFLNNKLWNIKWFQVIESSCTLQITMNCQNSLNNSRKPKDYAKLPNLSLLESLTQQIPVISSKSFCLLYWWQSLSWEYCFIGTKTDKSIKAMNLSYRKRNPSISQMIFRAHTHLIPGERMICDRFTN